MKNEITCDILKYYHADAYKVQFRYKDHIQNFYISYQFFVTRSSEYIKKTIEKEQIVFKQYIQYQYDLKEIELELLDTDFWDTLKSVDFPV